MPRRARRLNERELDAYDHIPRALAEQVVVIRVPVVMPGMSAMTVGRRVFVLSDEDHDGTRKLLAHELVHVRQWHELGIARFLARYYSSYLRQLVRHRRHHAAYRAIGLEVEAYDLADEWASSHRRAPGTDPRG